MKKKLDMVVPSHLVDEIVSEMKDFAQIEMPFTRLYWPDKINLVKNIRPDKPNLDMIYCEDLESARKLRTELIRSLELLNYYIDQVEETGEIRYVR